MKELLERLIRNIIDINVFIVNDNLESLQQEINPNYFSLQLNKEYLSSFINNMEENIYYEIIDNLNQRIFIFKFEDDIFIVGPYIKRFINENEINKLATENHIPPSMIEEFKMQYFSLHVIDPYHLERVLNSIINSLYKDKYFKYTYKKINFYDKKEIIPNQNYVSNDNFIDQIYKKYEIENTLLYQVEHGQVDEIKLALENIGSVFQEDYLTKFYQVNPQAAMASYRTLLRKAAEKSSLPVPIIDRIISKYTQIMLSSSQKEQLSLISSLAIELSNEVRTYLMNAKYESPLIKDVCEYLYTNYNKDISLDKIALKFHINKYYLLHQFKQETNKTMKEYVESIRILRAKEMLKDNLLTISQIGTLIGYPDNNYFTKVFKKNVHVTPSEYRSQNLK
jgi:two-component system, response regulator YesN